MEPVFFLPSWFFPWGILLELFFAGGAFVFSYHAWRIYSFTEVRRMKLLAGAFLFFALSYAIQAITNLFHISFFYADLITGNQKVLLMQYAASGFILCQAMGVVLLLYMVTEVQDSLFFIVLLALAGVVLATQSTLVFVLYAFAGLLLVSASVLYRYWLKRRTLHLLYGLFILLLAADKIGLLSNRVYLDGSVVSHLILAASSTILIIMLLTVHHGKKK